MFVYNGHGCSRRKGSRSERKSSQGSFVGLGKTSPRRRCSSWQPGVGWHRREREIIPDRVDGVAQRPRGRRDRSIFEKVKESQCDTNPGRSGMRQVWGARQGPGRAGDSDLYPQSDGMPSRALQPGPGVIAGRAGDRAGAGRADWRVSHWFG